MVESRVDELRRPAVAGRAEWWCRWGRTVGVVGAVLGVFYAVFVRFYQAAGGRIGMAGSVLRDPATAQMASYAAGLLILLGAAACVVLTHPGARRLGGRDAPATIVAVLCATPALLGGLFGMIHGIGGGTTHLMELMGMVSISYPAEAWAVHDVIGGDVWTVLFYEPWFLAMGLSLVLSVGVYVRQIGVGPRLLRIAGWTCAVVVVLGAAVSIWMVLSHRVLVIG